MHGIEDHLNGIADCVRRTKKAAPGLTDEQIRAAIDQGARDRFGEPEEGSESAAEVDDGEQKPVEKQITVSIAKANDEQQTVTGVVLQPETVDGQGDIMSSDVIRETAYKFLANFNRTTKLGLQHSSFPKGKLALVESYVAPISFVLGSKTVKEGSWLMTVKVLDKKLWKKVKDGQITGFSIGGRAKVVSVEAA